MSSLSCYYFMLHYWKDFLAIKIFFILEVNPANPHKIKKKIFRAVLFFAPGDGSTAILFLRRSLLLRGRTKVRRRAAASRPAGLRFCFSFFFRLLLFPLPLPHAHWHTTRLTSRRTDAHCTVYLLAAVQNRRAWLVGMVGMEKIFKMN